MKDDIADIIEAASKRNKGRAVRAQEWLDQLNERLTVEARKRYLKNEPNRNRRPTKTTIVKADDLGLDFGELK